jgi:hypothetical protein
VRLSPEARPEIALHLANRMVWVADAHRRHHVQTLATTCQLALAVPGLDPAVTGLAARLLDEQDGDA